MSYRGAVSTVLTQSMLHIKTAEQRTILHQYGDWYTGRWLVGCYIWYSEERPGRATPRLVPTSLYQM